MVSAEAYVFFMPVFTLGAAFIWYEFYRKMSGLPSFCTKENIAVSGALLLVAIITCFSNYLFFKVYFIDNKKGSSFKSLFIAAPLVVASNSALLYFMGSVLGCFSAMWSHGHHTGI